MMVRCVKAATFALFLLAAPVAFAFDVTSPEARQQTLLEYIKGREDLSAEDKASWEKTLRLVFGGKALKPSDEAVTAAKSVISAGIFFNIDKKKVANAAYEAHNDVLSWVPSPIAIDYQLLTLQGRRPKESSRLIAFNFPKYFNEELAPEYVSWWGEQLDKGTVNPHMLPTVERQVSETRVLMRPMLRERLWKGVELEARLAAMKEAELTGAPVQEVERQLKELAVELQRDFRRVSAAVAAEDASLSYAERYQKVSAELKQPVAQAPRFQFQRQPKPIVPTPVPTRPLGPNSPNGGSDDSPKDGQDKGGGVKNGVEKNGGEKNGMPKTTPPPSDKPTKPGLPPSKTDMMGPAPTLAPMPGEPLISVSREFPQAFDQSVDEWSGTPYLFGGESRRGIDCSAFTRQVFRESTAVELPRTSGQQFGTGEALEPAQLQKGDVVFFDTLERGRITHVGVYVGEGQFAHASSSRGVTRDKFQAKWAQRAYRGARRIMAR